MNKEEKYMRLRNAGASKEEAMQQSDYEDVSMAYEKFRSINMMHKKDNWQWERVNRKHEKVKTLLKRHKEETSVLNDKDLLRMEAWLKAFNYYLEIKT